MAGRPSLGTRVVARSQLAPRPQHTDGGKRDRSAYSGVIHRVRVLVRVVGHAEETFLRIAALADKCQVSSSVVNSPLEITSFNVCLQLRRWRSPRTRHRTTRLCSDVLRKIIETYPYGCVNAYRSIRLILSTSCADSLLCFQLSVHITVLASSEAEKKEVSTLCRILYSPPATERAVD